MSWRQVVTWNEERRPEIPVVHLSIACNHCHDAPCMAACPALAYSQDPATGTVTLDAELCIGCRYCSWACPYDAPRFDEAEGVMTKCTFCSHRQARGLEPACVEQCPTGALGFGELERLPGVENAPGMPTTRPGPSIRFVGTEALERRPELAVDGGVASPPREAPRKITLRSEWPLVGFTLLAAWLVSAFAASAVGKLALNPFVFLGATALSFGLSTLHLGKKLRAWRAVLNVRRSWLSREVVLYSGFGGLAAAWFLFGGSRELAGVAVLVGAAALFAMDRVYDVVRTGPRMHSADLVRTALLLLGLWLGYLPWSIAFGAIKLYLYAARKLRGFGRARPAWSFLRIATGFVFPVAMFFVDRPRWALWALAGTAVGDLVDRCELYEELEVPTPQRQMARESSQYSSQQAIITE